MLACLGLLACLLAVPALAEEGESAVPEGEIPAQWQQVMEEAPMTQEEFQSQTAQGWLALAGEALQDAAQAPVCLFLKLCGILLLLAAAKTLCTENGVFYFLQMGSSSARVMDERALAFLKTHTDRLMVLDAMEYGMDAVDEGVRAYLEPALFYAMNVELRAARGKRFDHSPEIRRYMGIEKY